MKLAMRPRNSPIGPTAQVRSPSDRIGMPRLRANSTTASTQPMKPPWNDMPPFHSCEDLERVRGEMRQVVEQHVADAAAEDDAERHPEHEIVEVGDRQRRRPAPQPLVADERARIEPAEQDADDIGERVPADRERPDMRSAPDRRRERAGRRRALKDRQVERRRADAAWSTAKSSRRRTRLAACDGRDRHCWTSNAKRGGSR